jgi:hypothetical protein
VLAIAVAGVRSIADTIKDANLIFIKMSKINV